MGGKKRCSQTLPLPAMSAPTCWGKQGCNLMPGSGQTKQQNFTPEHPVAVKMHQTTTLNMGVEPKIGVSQNGWFIVYNGKPY